MTLRRFFQQPHRHAWRTAACDAAAIERTVSFFSLQSRSPCGLLEFAPATIAGLSAIRRQYFLAFALMGSVLPYLSVWLANRGLSDAQVGYVISTTGVGVMVSPLLITLLADTRFDRRRLLAAQQFAASLSLGVMLLSTGFTALLLAHLVFALALTPVIPLQDAVLFSEQGRQRSQGGSATPYHRVRVFGTLGFMVPSVLLFAHLRLGGSLDWAVGLAAGFAMLGAINARWLPRGETPAASPREADATSGRGSGGRRGSRLPTVAAAKSVMRSDALVFAGAMWLLFIAMSAYYTFYPVLLTRPTESGGVGLDAMWIGLIANVGVAIELPFMLCFGWLLRRLGPKRLMTLGAAAMAIRMGLLWLFPIPAVAIGTQVLHGPMVLVMHVAPPVFFNRFAAEAYRSSVQGLYVVLVTGTGRIVGNVTGGQVATVGLGDVFFYATLLCLAATALFALAFRPRGEAAGVEA